MNTIKDNEEPPPEYWKDVDSEDWEKDYYNYDPPKRLIEGIDIKELCSGKEIMFEISKDNNEDTVEPDSDISEEVMYRNPKLFKQNREAEILNGTFEEIASKMTNVTENGFVKKKIVSIGVGKNIPDGAYVTIHYNLYKESCKIPFDSTYMRNSPEKFRLDHGETLLGLEFAIKSMKKSENSMFFIKWEYAFGAMGCPERIEAKCDIIADITLINVVDLDVDCDLTSSSSSDASKMDFRETIGNVKRFLCNGSDDFLNGEPRKAVQSYQKAHKILKSMRLTDEEQEKEMLKQKLKCLVNLAVCYNKLRRFEQACVCCQEALSIDPNNVKAHFHYGRATLALSNFPVSERHLRRANALKPEDKDINLEMIKLNKKKELYALNDKIFCQKAFNEGKELKGKPSPLEIFEKDLIASLDKCLKYDKPHVVMMPLNKEQKKICNRVSSQLKIRLERNPAFWVFIK